MILLFDTATSKSFPCVRSDLSILRKISPTYAGLILHRHPVKSTYNAVFLRTFPCNMYVYLFSFSALETLSSSLIIAETCAMANS